MKEFVTIDLEYDCETRRWVAEVLPLRVKFGSLSPESALSGAREFVEAYREQAQKRGMGTDS